MYTIIILLLVFLFISLSILSWLARKQLKAGKLKESQFQSLIDSLNKQLEVQKLQLESDFRLLLNTKLNELKLAHQTEIKNARKDAVDTSRAVLKGKISEEIAPFLPNFPYNSSDCKFFGSPIDFIVFEGMSSGEIKKIIVLDVKTGKSRLSKVQNQIKKCVENGLVEFVKFDPEIIS